MADARETSKRNEMKIFSHAKDAVHRYSSGMIGKRDRKEVSPPADITAVGVGAEMIGRPADAAAPAPPPLARPAVGGTRRVRGPAQRSRGALLFKKDTTLDSLRQEEAARKHPGDDLAAVLGGALDDERLCDLALVGLDGIAVMAPRFVLAAHSSRLADLFYPRAAGGGVVAGDEGAPDASRTAAPPTATVELDFAAWDAIDAVVRFLVSRALPPGLEDVANEFNVRTLCQIHLLGRLFAVPSLVRVAYNTARVLMNLDPPLACAAFDECRRTAALLGPTQRPSPRVDELADYALEYMREMPKETLLAKGTQYLNADSLEAIICDQEMDVDEITMFNILSIWVDQEEDNIEVGKRLVANIDLCHMESHHLKYNVKKCGFVDVADIDAALEQIEEGLANESQGDKEHVLVAGAGHEGVNGIYVRLVEDIGMGEEEVMFVKEAAEEDTFGLECSLFLMRTTWAITLAVDSSNVLYSCEIAEGSILPRPPESGWRTVKGVDLPPTCTWSPSKADRLSGKRFVAPDLASCGRPTAGDSLDRDEGAPRKMSLRKMMSLPVDEGHEDEDYQKDQSQRRPSLPIHVGRNKVNHPGM